MHSPLTPYRKRNLGLQHSDFAPLGAHVPGIKGSDDTLAMILLSLCALLLLLAFIILPLLPTHRIANARPLPRPTPSPVITQELPSPTATPTPSPTATPTPTPSPTATPTPIIHTLTSQQTQSKTVNATGQGATPGTQATGTVRISNGDTLNSLNIPAGTTYTNVDGCIANDLQISLDSDVSLPPDTGTVGTPSPDVTVAIHVVQPGTAGNIQ